MTSITPYGALFSAYSKCLDVQVACEMTQDDSLLGQAKSLSHSSVQAAVEIIASERILEARAFLAIHFILSNQQSLLGNEEDLIQITDLAARLPSWPVECFLPLLRSSSLLRAGDTAGALRLLHESLVEVKGGARAPVSDFVECLCRERLGATYMRAGRIALARQYLDQSQRTALLNGYASISGINVKLASSYRKTMEYDRALAISLDPKSRYVAREFRRDKWLLRLHCNATRCAAALGRRRLARTEFRSARSVFAHSDSRSLCEGEVFEASAAEALCSDEPERSLCARREALRAWIESGNHAIAVARLHVELAVLGTDQRANRVLALRHVGALYAGKSELIQHTRFLEMTMSLQVLADVTLQEYATYEALAGSIVDPMFRVGAVAELLKLDFALTGGGGVGRLYELLGKVESDVGQQSFTALCHGHSIVIP